MPMTSWAPNQGSGSGVCLFTAPCSRGSEEVGDLLMVTQLEEPGTKVCLVKAMVFLVVMYGCKS